MLNLHAPFRWAEPGDADAIAALQLQAASAGASTSEIVVADVEGRVTAALAGQPAGETWGVELLVVQLDRLDELGPSLLAIADALAADDGLAAVTLDAGSLRPELVAFLDREGFRPGEGGSALLSRPVVPQG